ncbi:hypothetical protein DSO57_1018021 [Entomophthora muscae]|uniref:Uncharacterized protein n=1 Tax=Entomophthora muscae TaxID=34485 RepID=A0ACC2UEF6_9FUNG|nr:hypothetical protein DSO57_1018021 [Entomophthora muscae]
MIQGPNKALLFRRKTLYSPEDQIEVTLDIRDAFISMGKPVQVSEHTLCEPKEDCEVAVYNQVVRNFAVEVGREWDDEEFKPLLDAIFFSEKTLPKANVKVKGAGIWTLYFKEIDLILDGNVLKAGDNKNNDKEANFRIRFPLSNNNELLGLLGYESLCSDSMPVPPQKNKEDAIILVKSIYCAKNDLSVFYQDY